jgi:hypothetical protein
MDRGRSRRWPPRWWGHWRGSPFTPSLTRQQLLGWVLVAASVLALLFSTVTGIKARETALCQQAAMAQDRATLRQLVADVFAAGVDNTARLEALRRYLDTPPANDC